MKESVEALIKKGNQEEQAELKVLYNSMVKKFNVYQADSTTAKMKDWRTAKNELALLIEKLNEKYDHNTRATSADSLEDIKSILAYLHGRGYQISRSGLYKHRDEGKFKKDKKTGFYLTSTIDKYASNHLPDTQTGQKASAASDALHLRKLRADIHEKEMRAAKAAKELEILDGKYILKQDMHRDLVGRGLVIDSEARHMIKTTIPEIIELAGGDQNIAPQAIELQLTKLDKMMNAFSSSHDFIVDLKIEDN